MRSRLAFVCALLASSVMPVWAQDGNLLMLATAVQGAQTKECDFWKLKYSGNSSGNGFGSCAALIDVKVYVELAGASAGGITGAEYSVQIGTDSGVDPCYSLVEIPTPAATVVLGSAFTPPDPLPRGIQIAMPGCQTGTYGRVLLENVFIFSVCPCGPGQTPPPLSLLGVRHSSPSNPLFQCPLLTLCDTPVFTKVCLGNNVVSCSAPGALCSTSGSFEINTSGLPNSPGSCPNAIGKPGRAVSQKTTWANVKSLYR